jgi:hypothetical protein
VGALATDAHRSSDVGDGHSVLADALHEQAATVDCQTSVTVTHEDLRVVKTAISTAPGVFALCQRPVTNVLAGYI